MKLTIITKLVPRFMSKLLPKCHALPEAFNAIAIQMINIPGSPDNSSPEALISDHTGNGKQENQLQPSGNSLDRLDGSSDSSVPLDLKLPPPHRSTVFAVLSNLSNSTRANKRPTLRGLNWIEEIGNSAT